MDVPLIKDGQEQQDKLGLHITQKKLCFFVNYQRSNRLPELSHLVSWDFPPQVFFDDSSMPGPLSNCIGS